MGLPVHDKIASTANLARAMRDALDMSRPETPVQTATLRLLLDTLIELAQPARVSAVADEARKTVASMILPSLLDSRGG